MARFPTGQGHEAWTAYQAGLSSVSDQELIAYADDRDAIVGDQQRRLHSVGEATPVRSGRVCAGEGSGGGRGHGTCAGVARREPSAGRDGIAGSAESGDHGHDAAAVVKVVKAVSAPGLVPADRRRAQSSCSMPSRMGIPSSANAAPRNR
ncbi:MAG: hypothetical protein GXP34_05440 [Actinobacteria bacterium]|nr:hypothetical protein [Actinomycetota bacterium]